FAEDVRQGLLMHPKRIASKYFYDEQGSKIFQAIMKLPEYYPTSCEFEVLTTSKQALLEAFGSGGQRFNLIEFGAGDGLKTKILLQHFTNEQAPFQYSPIDISKDALEGLTTALGKEIPQLQVTTLHMDYFKGLAWLKANQKMPKVVLFLGSNIGNFNDAQSVDFLGAIGQYLNPEDLLLVGFDLQKNPKVILDAYNDASGVTKAFNMNLLTRINRELGADFDLSKFDHYPTYDPLTGEAKSFLVSLANQQVSLKALDMMVSFNNGEAIHTEISRKFSLEQVESLARRAGFRVRQHFFDCKHYYVDSLWQPDR
ncbi:MAG: L-histidine N(alpha)-methyltransferase, partial [Bacteroidota bacterium]